jgi:hypothetical protein
MSFVCRTLLAPTAHSAAAWFQIGRRSAIAVASGCELAIFELVAVRSEQRVGADGQVVDEPLAAQLRALHSEDLHGSVQSLRRVALTGGAAAASGLPAVDALLLTFGAGKVSLVGYDPLTASLRTLVMLNFEHDAIGPGAAPQRAIQRAVRQVIHVPNFPPSFVVTVAGMLPLSPCSLVLRGLVPPESILCSEWLRF